MARTLAAEWPPAAERLASLYWPGPLTLVLPKRNLIPDSVTAGLPTVGLRVPRHPVALALLRAAGVPIAAPSANPFMGLSPTQAAHISATLADLILEGGPSEVGIESTVVSLAGVPTLLRPGMIPRAELEAALGVPLADAITPEGSHASPGQHPQHYSPSTPFLVLSSAAPFPPGRGAWLGIYAAREAARPVTMPQEPHRYAQKLYEILHTLDVEKLDWIAAETPPADSAWDGIRDRLLRAQHS